MDKIAQDKVKALLVSEFLQYGFIKAVLEAKKISLESDTGKLLCGTLHTKTFNALVGYFDEKWGKNFGVNDCTTWKVGVLLEQSSASLRRIPNVGKKTVGWLEVYLDLFDLKLKGRRNIEQAQLSPDAKEVIDLLKQ